MTMTIIVRVAGFTQVAAFNPPKRGDRITISSPRALFARDPYWLVMDISGSASQGWNATVRGQDGNSQALHSSDVTSWKIYAGDKYPWEVKEEEIRKQRSQNDENKRLDAEQKQKAAEMSTKYKFRNGDPLVIPAGGLLVMVANDASGQLDLFAGKALTIVSVDPNTETAKMAPVVKDDASLSEFAQFIESVPLAEVAKDTSPVIPAVLATREVKIPDLEAPTDEKGNRPNKAVKESEIPGMVPNLLQAILRGQITGPYRNGEFVRVFVNYDEDKGLSKFKQEMQSYGINIAESDMELDNARFKVYPNGMKSPMHYYTGAMFISDPSPELVKELQKVAPASNIISRGNGVVVHSNTLFRLYMKLRGSPSPGRMASRAWVRSICKFA
jgi:hypothetical protein